MPRETSIAAPVVAQLEADSYDVYQEVSLDYRFRAASIVGDGRADIVAVRLGHLLVVECKQHLTFELFAEAERWKPYANAVWIAVPHTKTSEGRRMALRTARILGFGVFIVNDGRVSGVSDASYRERESDALIESLTEGHRTHAKAGSNQGGQFTEFRGTAEALAKYVAEHEGCKLWEAVAGIRHHYRNRSIAEERLEKLIRKGQVPGVKFGALQRLWPPDSPMANR